MKGPLEEGQQGREYRPDTKPLARTQTLGKVSSDLSLMHCHRPADRYWTTWAAACIYVQGCCCVCTPSCQDTNAGQVSSGMPQSSADAAGSAGRLHLRCLSSCRVAQLPAWTVCLGVLFGTTSPSLGLPAHRGCSLGVGAAIFLYCMSALQDCQLPEAP